MWRTHWNAVERATPSLDAISGTVQPASRSATACRTQFRLGHRSHETLERAYDTSAGISQLTASVKLRSRRLR